MGGVRKMFKAGTVAELKQLEVKGKIPEEVYQDALRIVTMLDEIFGEDRDVDFDDGGFIFIAESREDLEYFNQNCVELDSETLEYVELVSSATEPYLNAFFLYNEYEQGATLFVPVAIAPERIRKRFLDETKTHDSLVVL
jgi:hypothetical protein